MTLRVLTLTLALSACAYPTDFGADPYTFDTGSYDDRYGTAWRTEGWTQRGEVWTPTSGIAVQRRDAAWLGMSGMTCAFDRQGVLESDLDPLPEVEERVTDAEGDTVVVVDDTTGEAVTIDPAGEAVSRHTVPGLEHALGDGKGDVIVLARDPEHGCAVAFHDGDLRTLVRVPLEPCADRRGFTVDTARDVAFVGNASHVFEVSRDGALALDLAGDLLAWDASAKVLYTATRGTAPVHAVDLADGLRWTVELPGAVRQVRAMGARGAAAVAIEGTDGDAVWVIDGATGEAAEALWGGPAVTDLAVSPGGGTLWVVTDHSAASFRVD